MVVQKFGILARPKNFTRGGRHCYPKEKDLEAIKEGIDILYVDENKLLNMILGSDWKTCIKEVRHGKLLENTSVAVTATSNAETCALQCEYKSDCSHWLMCPEDHRCYLVKIGQVLKTGNGSKLYFKGQKTCYPEVEEFREIGRKPSMSHVLIHI